MSSQRSYDRPRFLREMQLGLVVYGGVSLAIYTHGICQEFYNAVRGRGIYKLVKALTDADLVVDVISGSSAGGALHFRRYSQRPIQGQAHGAPDSRRVESRYPQLHSGPPRAQGKRH